ncbi:Hydrogen peroxide-inducible genes activator [Pseudoalteromonas holothuriae]|uniref:Hydrogen peroxide-inducible genes activator n=1 Tax=Pseudoalteromonas holothuriae TaxID=2963714 RepID=A0A9W4VXI4_9GAMM|nr:MULTISPECIES: hydrogen peroxide-inducible genes activator [unclassified Pseudoalteromonas]CAH9054229.1 Hydrogen peroxide-inducible genes activator [Pseudoalteromonas sp. CIP111854]CAH9058791.1 Hydrogen peroxide-inducible genes activator [Pseudoalteromonas sp. CIP111951]
MTNLPSIKQLQYLIAVHQHQHFGRAAEACFIGQSTLSSAIQTLEETLGCQLIERENRSLMFTDIGEEVVIRAKKIIADTMSVKELTKSYKHPLSGKLTLGVIPTVASFIAAPLYQFCLQQFNQLQLVLVEDTSDKLLDKLEHGHIDMAMLALPYHTERFHTQVLAKDHFSLVHHQDYEIAADVSDLNLLPDKSVFLLEREHCMTGHALSACHLNRSDCINPFEAANLHTLLSMVEYQNGVTFLPQMALNAGILQGKPIVTNGVLGDAYREIGLLWRKTTGRIHDFRLFSEKVGEFVNQQCEQAKKEN